MAAFARAPWTRLLVVQTAVAVWVAVSLIVYLSRGWFPVVTGAIQELTDFGELRDGQLAWPKKEAVLLGENRFLGLVVDLEEVGGTGQVADLQFEFGRNRIKLVSLLGYTSFPYPADWAIEINRPILAPWWGAWRPAIGFGAGLLLMLFLYACWFFLAGVACLPVRLVAWLAGRDTTLLGCWRLAAAAWLPGTMWMGGALLLYSFEQFSLVGLGLAAGFSVLIGLAYGLAAPFRLSAKERPRGDAKGNPFTSHPQAAAGGPKAALPADPNPFQPRSTPPRDNR